MYYQYETTEMSKWKIDQFEMFINNRIGIEFEVNKVDDDLYCIFVIEANRSEIKMVQDFESSIIKC